MKSVFGNVWSDTVYDVHAKLIGQVTAPVRMVVNNRVLIVSGFYPQI